MSFLKDIVKEIDNEYAAVVSDGVAAGDTSGYIDTGSYIFNGLVSGSIHKGVPGNKITAIAGCLLYTSPSPRDRQKSRMPSSA